MYLICVLQMYVRCTLNLCITTLPSKKCPDLCSQSLSPRALVGNLYTETFTVSSGPVSLLASTSETTPPPIPTVDSITSLPSQLTTANGKILCFLSFALKHPQEKQQCNASLLLAVTKIKCPNTYLLLCCSSKAHLSRDSRGDFDHHRHRPSACHLLLTTLLTLDQLALRLFFLSCQCKWW